MELELAAAEWAVRKNRLYLVGLPFFSLIVDHQTLVSILNRKTLDEVESPKRQRLKEPLSAYVFETVWHKGSTHSIPDALSRAPINHPSAEDMALTDSDSQHMRNVIIHSIQHISQEDSPIINGNLPKEYPGDPLLGKLRAVAA